MVASSSGSVAIGVALACLAATTNATGLNLQRVGKRKKLPALSLLGVILAASCGIIDLVSFSFAPQSLLAPFGAVTLLINLLLAPLLHNDKITRLDLASCFCIFCGVALCLSNASTEPPPAYLYDKLVALALRPAFRSYAYFVTGSIGLLAWRVASPFSVCPAPAFPVLAGMVGGCTVLCSKLLPAMFAAEAPTSTIGTIGAIAAVSAVVQTSVLNIGIGRHSSLVVVPIFVATFVASNALGGGLYFEEFASFTLEQSRHYALGLVLLVVGVVIVSFKPPDIASSTAGDAQPVERPKVE